MNYSIIAIVLVLLICISVTNFLIKDTFSSKRKRIFFSLTTIFFSSIITIISLKFNTHSVNPIINTNKHNSIELTNNKIIYSNNESDYVLSPDNNVILGSIKSFIATKNFKDTEFCNVDKNTTVFIFFNHPNDTTIHNTLDFSFKLEKKYENFSCCIEIPNYKEINNRSTYIKISADEELIYNSDDIFPSSSPLYINLGLSNVSTLSFSINTGMNDILGNMPLIIFFNDINVE